MQINRKVRPEILDSVALLVLDAQDSLIDTLHNKDSFLKRAAFAIEAARNLRIHTIFTEQAPEKLGRANAALFKLANNPKVFAKQTFSALGAPGIENYLRDREIYHLLVVGLETSICIYQTGLQATDEDVDITFLSDALGSRRAEDDAPVLDALARLGCQVLPSETVFYSLLGDVQSPYFRSLNQIVKAFGEPDFTLDGYLRKRAEPSNDDEANEQPQRNAPPARDERTARVERPQQSARHEERNRPGRTERPARPDRTDRPERIAKSEQEETASTVSVNEVGEDTEERRSRKRGRRRRGRGRGRDERQPSDETTSDEPRPDHVPSTVRPERTERPERSAPRADWREKRPGSEEGPRAMREPSPAPNPVSHAEPKPVAEPAPELSPIEAPIVAKKVAKKAAKKATKKVAKKAVKKTAKKAARKSATPQLDPTE